MDQIDIVILQYDGAMQSAILGLEEMFMLANQLQSDNPSKVLFCVKACTTIANDHTPRIVIVPPCIEDECYRAVSDVLIAQLSASHQRGSVLCSVCAGAFLLARTGLLHGRPATTHWLLTDDFKTQFPTVFLDANKILIDDGDLITAGGLMAWLDLGLELVARFGSPALMRQLGKHLVVDTAPREQRYYRRFIPRLNHGDRAILKAQHWLQRQFSEPVSITALADLTHLSERTFQRRFAKATGETPSHYVQQLRINKACEQLESGTDTVEQIASAVGYEDVSAFRKTFVRITGLTPRGFRQRFNPSPTSRDPDHEKTLHSKVELIQADKKVLG